MEIPDAKEYRIWDLFTTGKEGKGCESYLEKLKSILECV